VIIHILISIFLKKLLSVVPSRIASAHTRLSHAFSVGGAGREEVGTRSKGPTGHSHFVRLSPRQVGNEWLVRLFHPEADSCPDRTETYTCPAVMQLHVFVYLTAGLLKWELPDHRRPNWTPPFPLYSLCEIWIVRSLGGNFKCTPQYFGNGGAYRLNSTLLHPYPFFFHS
jgi:hypothetical protein